MGHLKMLKNCIFASILNAYYQFEILITNYRGIPSMAAKQQRLFTF
jgi:hypothetical protein